ncbi:MAG: carboxypeptidase-like regulatory domain-containing protein [Planctomycetia bacterium]
MSLAKAPHLPVAAFLAVAIMVGMPALARLHPKPSQDPWTRSRPLLFPVAGTLVFEGKPVSGAVVTFVAAEPGEGRQYMAVSSTDKDGRFWLRTFSSYGDGAVPGRHRVKVEKLVPTGRMILGHGMTSILDIGSIPPWLDPEREGGPYAGPPMDAMMMDPMMGSSAFPGMPEMVNILPSRFADDLTSGIVAEVMPIETNEFLIRLYDDPPPEVEADGDDDAKLGDAAADHPSA